MRTGADPCRVGSRGLIPVIIGSGTRSTSTLGIVDSGATGLVISTDAADYLRVERHAIPQVASTRGPTRAETADVELRIPGGRKFKTTCVIADQPMSVILGRTPLFDEHMVTFDYSRGTVSLTPLSSKGRKRESARREAGLC